MTGTSGHCICLNCQHNVHIGEWSHGRCSPDCSHVGKSPRVTGWVCEPVCCKCAGACRHVEVRPCALTLVLSLLYVWIVFPAPCSKCLCAVQGMAMTGHSPGPCVCTSAGNWLWIFPLLCAAFQNQTKLTCGDGSLGND